MVGIGSWGSPMLGAQSATLLLVLLCLRVFIGHGQRAVTPLGIFTLVTLLAGAFPAYVAWDDNRVSATALFVATTSTFFLTFIVTAISWKSFTPIIHSREILPGSWLFALVGAAVFALGYLMRGREVLPGMVVEILVIVGIFFVAWGTWWSKHLSVFVLSMPLLVGMTLIYIFQVHSGQGRLRIAAVGLGLLLLFSLRVPNILIKIAAIVVGPASWQFSQTCERRTRKAWLPETPETVPAWNLSLTPLSPSLGS